MASLEIAMRPAFPWKKLGIALAIGAGLASLYGILDLVFNLAYGQRGCTILFYQMAPYCGTKIGIALALCLLVTPVAIYFSLQRPWIFPGALYAFLIPSDSYLNLTSAGSVTKIAGAMLFLALIIWAIRTKRVTTPDRATWLWILYFGYISLSLFWAFNPGYDPLTIDYSTVVQLVSLYLLLVVVKIDESDFNILLMAFLMGSCFASVYGAHTFGNAAASGALNQGRLKLKFDSQNKIASDVFAASLVFPIGMAVMNVLRNRFGFKKLAYLGVFAVLMIGQYVVASRGAIVADCIAIAYFFWKSRYRAQLMAVATSGFVVSLLFPSAIWARFFNPHDTSGSGRIQIWRVGWMAFKHNWLYGSGLGTFALEYNKYMLTIFNSEYVHWYRGAHNILLESSVEGGIIGCSLLLIAWYWTFKSLRHIRKTDRHWDLRVMMEGSLLATFVSGLFVGIMYEKFTWLVFALLAMARTVTLPAAIERDVELEPAGLPAGQQPAIATQKFPLVPS